MKNKTHRYIANEIYMAGFRMYSNMLLLPLLIIFMIQLLLVGTMAYRRFRQLSRLPVPGPTRTISLQTFQAYYFDFTFGLSPRITIPPEFLPLFKKQGYTDSTIPQADFRRLIDRIYPGRFRELPGRISRDIKNSSLLYLLFFIYIPFSVHRSRSFTQTKFVRGAHFIPFQKMKKRLEENAVRESGPEYQHYHLWIGQLPLPRKAELKHLLILGATGTGKSVLLNQLVAQSRRRQSRQKDRLVIYDVKGEFLSKHFREGDIIYYPFDQRSIHWSFFNEIRNYQDFDTVAHALFQAPETDRDIYWYDSAGQVFKSGLMCLSITGKTSNRNIIEFFNRGAAQIKADFLSYLPLADRGAIKHIDKSESQQAASILSILQSRINFFRYLLDMDGPFSFRDYVRNKEDKRNIFILNIKQNDLIFKHLMTFVVDIMIREVLSLEDSREVGKGNFTFIIDEFGSLQKLSSIFDFLTISRSKGGSLIVANQDLGSVIHVYGEAQKSTFFNNFNTSITFKLNDPVTAEFISRAVGEKEVIKVMDSHQMSPESMGDRFSLNSQEKIENVLLPSELLHLPEFHAYVKISDHGLTRVQIPKNFPEALQSPYLERDLTIGSFLQAVPALETPVSENSSNV